MMEDIVDSISPLFFKHKIKCVVDVFGGSGKFLLNIPLEWNISKVYNDIDKRLSIVFKTLQDETKRNIIIEKLEWSLQSRQFFDDTKEDMNNRIDEMNDIDITYNFLYLVIMSFNGGLTSYSRKSGHLNSFIDNIKKNWKYIRKWSIENMDYMDLFNLYDNKTTFFYLDPPYMTGGSNYKYSFSNDDFISMNNKISNIKGYYLFNESEVDFKKIIDIFGKPNHVKSYMNRFSHKTTYRLEGFWYNF